MCSLSQEEQPLSIFTPSFLFLSSNAEDRTQTGHVLGDPQPGGAEVASDRGLSPVVFILSRLLTHLAMLVGATRDPQVLAMSCYAEEGSAVDSFCLKPAHRGL